MIAGTLIAQRPPADLEIPTTLIAHEWGHASMYFDAGYRDAAITYLGGPDHLFQTVPFPQAPLDPAIQSLSVWAAMACAAGAGVGVSFDAITDPDELANMIWGVLTARPGDLHVGEDDRAALRDHPVKPPQHLLLRSWRIGRRLATDRSQLVDVVRAGIMQTGAFTLNADIQRAIAPAANAQGAQ